MLPSKCMDFLKKNKGKIIKLDPDELELEEVIFFSEKELKQKIQKIILNNQEKEITYINLIKKDIEEGYLTDGILVWIPELNSFATFDNDHQEGYIFEDIAWNEIEENLGIFINAQWFPEMLEDNIKINLL